MPTWLACQPWRAIKPSYDAHLTLQHVLIAHSYAILQFRQGQFHPMRVYTSLLAQQLHLNLSA